MSKIRANVAPGCFRRCPGQASAYAQIAVEVVWQGVRLWALLMWSCELCLDYTPRSNWGGLHAETGV